MLQFDLRVTVKKDSGGIARDDIEFDYSREFARKLQTFIEDEIENTTYLDGSPYPREYRFSISESEIVK